MLSALQTGEEMGLKSWLKERGWRAGSEKVHLSEEGILHRRPDGATDWLPWGDLERVEVLTTSRESRAEDFFFLLSGRGGRGCVVPHGLSEGLFERLQQLPRFDLASFIRATTSTRDARFLCWSRGN